MFSKRNKIKIKSLKAVIVAEEEQIEIGKLQTKWQNIYEVIKKEYEKEIFLAISFFIMSVIASILYKSGNQLSSAGQPSGSIVESSANDLLILILALLFILFLRFLFYQPSLKYE